MTAKDAKDAKEELLLPGSTPRGAASAKELSLERAHLGPWLASELAGGVAPRRSGRMPGKGEGKGARRLAPEQPASVRPSTTTS